jgi:hypothetical protein
VVQETVDRVGEQLRKLGETRWVSALPRQRNVVKRLVGSSLIGSISGLPFGPISFQKASASAWFVIFRKRLSPFLRSRQLPGSPLPTVAIHGCRTDDVMRSETLTIDVNHYLTIEPRGYQNAVSGRLRT